MNDKSVILVVDDQPQNIELFEAYLIPQGYEVLSANSGEEALKMLSFSKIDIVLLDVMMPVMDGFEVIRRLRKDKNLQLLPVILVTALRGIEDRIKGIDAGCDDFLSKPIDKLELLARIRSLLKGKAYDDLMSNYRQELELTVNIRTEELRKLADVLSESNKVIRRFVPERFLKQLGKSSLEEVKLGDYIATNMVIMFADIRDFTSIAEKMTPKETFTFINQYMAKLSPPVRNHNGFIDKYIGDGIMALFPAVTEDAVRCAIEMHKQLNDFNTERKTNNELPIKIGIGLHEGCLMLGTIGEDERMDATVISDDVNIASRIEGISKQFGLGIAVSERIISSMAHPESYHYRFMGNFKVKGRHKTVSIFEIYDGDPEDLLKKKDAIKENFQKGLKAFYLIKFEQATLFFKDVLVVLPDDKASLHYIRIMRGFNRP